jgi:hypothetical protein
MTVANMVTKHVMKLQRNSTTSMMVKSGTAFGCVVAVGDDRGKHGHKARDEAARQQHNEHDREVR